MSYEKLQKKQDNDLASLRRRVERLTAENQSLRDTLQQVRKDRIEYLQNVSHQLVAPLNAIKWHIENLTEGKLSIDRARKVLRSIYSQSTLAVHLAKNFALMSNLEADHSLSALKEPLKWINLCELMINLADDFQPLAWDKNVDIVVERRSLDSVPQVLAMRPLISQVLSNIIENAVKYSDPNTMIEIDGFYNKTDDTVSVRIRNQGISLNDNDLARVFDRGFRSQEAKNRYPAGTGFGLYIARRIMEIHQGTISATMNREWVVFTVSLTVRGLEGKARQRA